MSFSTRRCQGRFRPLLEALEDRAVPAVLGPFLEGPGPVPGTAAIFFIATPPASGGSNTLVLVDDGSGGIQFATSKTGALKPAPTVAKNAPQPLVSRIDYFASTGSDSLNYVMLNGAPLAEHMQVIVHMPPAGNKAPVASSTGSTPVNFTATFGVAAISSNAGGPGLGATPGTPSQPLNITGELDVVILGSPRKDSATLNYDGRVNGVLKTAYLDPQRVAGPHAHGQEGDLVSFNLMLEALSTGRVQPRILGGVGDDKLTLFVRKLRKKDHVHILQSNAVNGGGGPNAAATFSFGSDSATLGQGATGINV